jgi:hypothetical protein
MRAVGNFAPLLTPCACATQSPPDNTARYLQHLEVTHFEGHPAVYIFFILIDAPVCASRAHAAMRQRRGVEWHAFATQVNVIGVSSTPKLKAALFSLVGAFATDVLSARGIWCACVRLLVARRHSA